MQAMLALECWLFLYGGFGVEDLAAAKLQPNAANCCQLGLTAACCGKLLPAAAKCSQLWLTAVSCG